MNKLKLIWLCTIPLNFAAKDFSSPESVFGGWLEGIARSIATKDDIDFSYYFLNPHKEVNESLIVNGISFFSIGIGGNKWKTITNISKTSNHIKLHSPNIVHMFGTESKLLNQIALSLGEFRIVVSLQGILSEYYKNYSLRIFQDYKFDNQIQMIFYNAIIQFNIFHLYFRSLNEKKLLNQVGYAIGRTDWDKRSVTHINSKVKYFHNYESLRPEFYNSRKWSAANYIKKRIYVSQGNYPIKGLHFLLKALSIVKQKYPDFELHISGENILIAENFASKLNISYSSFIKKIIDVEEMHENIKFVGYLTADKVCEALLSSNIFIMPSTIENSPNSLAEAMYLGVPTICSKVGGVESLVNPDIDVLAYQFDDVARLAEYIELLFSDMNRCVTLSSKSIESSRSIYNRENNGDKLLEIYQSILKS